MDWIQQYTAILDLIDVIATGAIALVAFFYSRRATRMNFILQSATMLNNVNAEFLASEDNLRTLAELRHTPSKDVRRDYLMLNNLNYLHTIWSLRQENTINTCMADAKLDNGAGFWVTASEKYIAEMLDRGFPEDFQREMSRRIAAQKDRAFRSKRVQS